MKHDPEFIIARINALTVPCPYCAAAPDEECVNQQTGYVLEHQPAHLLRLREAHVL